MSQGLNFRVPMYYFQTPEAPDSTAHAPSLPSACLAAWHHLPSRLSSRWCAARRIGAGGAAPPRPPQPPCPAFRTPPAATVLAMSASPPTVLPTLTSFVAAHDSCRTQTRRDAKPWESSSGCRPGHVDHARRSRRRNLHFHWWSRGAVARWRQSTGAAGGSCAPASRVSRCCCKAHHECGGEGSGRSSKRRPSQCPQTRKAT